MADQERVVVASPVVTAGAGEASGFAFVQMGIHSLKIDKRTGDTWRLSYNSTAGEANWKKVGEKA
ncbi:hypothetical protein EON81_06795 [bacterium]|nr:MAG: hypothetical protein EON81_06795 [bacterium]